ncbi:helix-turn-helix domain-containing protein [Sulfurifustis variabilis]|nr:helix-turn-helix domain-containing protein [Sulfurifustis variabilis]
MEHNWILLSLPAVIALGMKIILMVYAGYSTIRTRQTRVFLLLLFVLAVHNVTEIMVFFHGREGIPLFDAFAYFAVATVALAVFVHVALSLALDNDPVRRPRGYSWALVGLYGYMVVLEVLLLGTDLLITGFAPLGYSYYRLPGPLYILFEFYAVSAFVAVITLLIYGSMRQQLRQRRLQCQYMLLGTSPMALLVVANIVLMHYGSNWLNTPVTFPIAATFFLAVTTYAVHQHRLFDIQFFIPWSKIRKRKTAFYGRIRSMIAEIADLVSVNQAIERLAETLRCPVALLGGPRPVLAAAGARQMAGISIDRLRHIDHIVVANEIADSRPDTYALMRQHGIAAIVPFYPHSQNASSWLLLGDSFSEHVYTPLDFRLVEELFDKMAELFLDKLLTMRTQLADAQRQIETLEHRLQTLEAALASTRQRVDMLSQENTRLLREQPADSLLEAAARTRTMSAVTLLGRDKEMLKRLRSHFPQMEHFAGPESASFRRQPPADLLICGLDSESSALERRLLAVLTSESRPRAVLFYGDRARDFAFEQRQELRSVPVEVLPPHTSDEALARKAQALIELGHAVHATGTDYPLMGRSAAFEALMGEARRAAGLLDPVFIKSDDAGEAIALAHYMHRHGDSRHAFVTVRVALLGDEPESGIEALRGLIDQARGGTLMIDNLCALPNALWDEIVSRTEGLSQVRLVAAGRPESGRSPEQLMRPFRPLLLEIPGLRDRRGDIPLMVHFFTLQFNLQSRTPRYLTQSETDELLGSQFPVDLSALRAAIYARLMSAERTPSSEPEVELAKQDRSLDEYVAEFEARLIEQTLKRCGGNKSKAARLLGLRPNTLHYKLERYGLSGRKS